MAAVLSVAVSALAQEEIPERRALWVDGRGQGLRTRAAVTRLIETAQTAGFDTLIPVARSQGEIVFPGDIEPTAPTVSNRMPLPLGELISQCREAEPPIQVFAAVDVLSVHRGVTLPPRGSLAQLHPQWIMEDRLGSRDVREDNTVHLFADPSIRGVRDHTAEVVRALVRGELIDGLVLDDLRYPDDGSEWGYSALALQGYRAVLGDVGMPEPNDASFTSWRRDQLTALLRDVTMTVRVMRPTLPIYVCIEASGSIGQGFENSDSYREHFQDLDRWLADGLCSGVVLKIYQDGRTEEGRSACEAWLRFAQDLSNRTDVIVAVQGALNYRNSLFAQIREARAHGLDVALHDYDYPARDHGVQFYENIRLAAFRPTSLLPADILVRSAAQAAASAEAENLAPPLDDSVASVLASDTAMHLAPDSLNLPEEASPVETISTPEPMVDPTMEPSSQFVAADRPAPDTSPAMAAPIAEVIAEVTAEESAEPSDALDLSAILPPPREREMVEPAPSERPSSGVFENLPPADLRASTSGTVLEAMREDVINLIGGRQIRGTVTDMSDGFIKVELDSGSVVRFPRSRIESIESNDSNVTNGLMNVEADRP